MEIQIHIFMQWASLREQFSFPFAPVLPPWQQNYGLSSLTRLWESMPLDIIEGTFLMTGDVM